MKKPMIKALAFATAITMVFSTPLTALADGLASLYAEGSAEGTGTGSGTTGTGTGTGEDHEIPGEKPDEETVAEIVGVLLDKDKLTVIAGESYPDTDTLSVSLIMKRGTSDNAGRIQTVTINSSNIDQYRDVMVTVNGARMTTQEVLQKCIVWDKNSEIISLERVTDKDNRQVLVKGKANTAGKAIVTVGIQGVPECTASAEVTVKKYATSLKFSKLGKMYVKHKVDMTAYLDQGGANDEITWKVYEADKRGKSTSYASIDSNGILTLKKATPSSKQIVVVATSEKGITATTDAFAIEAGTPITKLTKVKGKDIKNLDMTKVKSEVLSVDVTTKGNAATTDFINWSSSNENVLAVSANGKANTYGESKEATIIPVAPGKATITATSTSGKKATFKITVKAPLQKITGITLEAGRSKIYAGQKVQLKAITVPEVCDEASKIKFKLASSSYKKIATVSAKGVLQANKKNETGSIEVIAYYKGVPDSPSVKFTIDPSTVQSVRIKPADWQNGMVFIAGQTVTKKLEVEVGGEGATEDMLSWSSSNSKVASVDSYGNVTALKTGTATITASALGADKKIKKDKVKITVKQAVERIELSKSDVTVNYKEGTNKAYTTTLKVSKQYPASAKKEKVKWAITSITVDGNTRVIDNVGDYETGGTGISIDRDKGKLTLPATTKNGTIVKVRAFCDNGAAAVATVTVCNQTQKVTVTEKKVDLKVGGTFYNIDKNLTVVSKADVDNKTGFNEKIVSYKASNGNVKIVRSKDGYVVYGVKAGKTTVTMKTASGKSAKITFTVTEN